jgi:hypothetical protein
MIAARATFRWRKSLWREARSTLACGEARLSMMKITNHQIIHFGVHETAVGIVRRTCFIVQFIRREAMRDCAKRPAIWFHFWISPGFQQKGPRGCPRGLDQM